MNSHNNNSVVKFSTFRFHNMCEINNILQIIHIKSYSKFIKQFVWDKNTKMERKKHPIATLLPVFSLLSNIRLVHYINHAPHIARLTISLTTHIFSSPYSISVQIKSFKGNMTALEYLSRAIFNNGI